MRRVDFDGHRLNSIVYVEDVRRPLWAGARVETADVPGADGTTVRSVTYASLTVEVDVRSIRRTKEEMRRDLMTLAGWLAVREPKRLAQSDRPGLYDLAVPTGTPSVDEWLGTGGATLAFLLPNPASWDVNESRATATAGAAARLVVAGTYAAAPTVSCADAVRDPSTGLWGVRLDGGDYCRVALPDDGAHAVAIDCGEATAAVDGADAMITLDSDWLSLDPGTHELALELGSGTAEAAWRARWL